MQENNLANEYISNIISVFDSVRQIYETNQNTIKEVEGSELDLKHEVQLTNKKNARDGYKVYSTWYDMLVRRRKAKDENYILEELYNFFEQNKDFKNRLSQIQGNVRKKFNSQLTRTYTPRQLTNLTCTKECSIVHKPFEDKLTDLISQSKYPAKKSHRNR